MFQNLKTNICHRRAMTNEIEKPAARVTLLDAVDLDVETHRILKDQLSKATKFLSPKFLTKWEAEMDAILRFGIWRLSVCRHQATFGQQLLRVKYSNDFSKRKGQLLVILTVGCSYLKQKVSQLSSTSDNQNSQQNLEKVKKILSALETTVLVASLVNLIIFLQHGNYPTLIDRILRLHPVSCASPGTSRVVGYQYMTRELLWHGFIELITFSLPLINYQYLKQKIMTLFSNKNKPANSALKRTTEYSPNTKCAFCNDVPILPHHIGCNHTFCYYCLESNRLPDKKYECPLCERLADESVSLITSNKTRMISAP